MGRSSVPGRHQQGQAGDLQGNWPLQRQEATLGKVKPVSSKQSSEKKEENVERIQPEAKRNWNRIALGLVHFRYFLPLHCFATYESWVRSSSLHPMCCPHLPTPLNTLPLPPEQGQTSSAGCWDLAGLCLQHLIPTACALCYYWLLGADFVVCFYRLKNTV